jgi:DNA adenine methylase
VEAVITAAHARLRRVTIEEQDFEEVLAFFDDPCSFAYLDPPYRGMSDGLYGRILADGEYERLHWCLAGAKGKWLMSHADDPFIRGIFRDFTISNVSTTYSLSGGANTESIRKERREILVCNYSVRTSGTAGFGETA